MYCIDSICVKRLHTLTKQGHTGLFLSFHKGCGAYASVARALCWTAGLEVIPDLEVPCPSDNAAIPDALPPSPQPPGLSGQRSPEGTSFSMLLQLVGLKCSFHLNASSFFLLTFIANVLFLFACSHAKVLGPTLALLERSALNRLREQYRESYSCYSAPSR